MRDMKNTQHDRPKKGTPPTHTYLQDPPAAPLPSRATWTLSEPKPGVVGLTLTAANGYRHPMIALTEQEAERLRSDLFVELYDRDVRAGKVEGVDMTEAEWLGEDSLAERAGEA